MAAASTNRLEHCLEYRPIENGHRPSAPTLYPSKGAPTKLWRRILSFDFSSIAALEGAVVQIAQTREGSTTSRTYFLQEILEHKKVDLLSRTDAENTFVKIANSIEDLKRGDFQLFDVTLCNTEGYNNYWTSRVIVRVALNHQWELTCYPTEEEMRTAERIRKVGPTEFVMSRFDELFGP